MPSTMDPELLDGVMMMAQSGRLDRERWLELLEQRRILLAPYLNHLTLRTLGFATWQGTALNLHRQLGRTEPDIMKTQGLFGAPDWEVARDGYQDVRLTWGLTRTGCWVVVELDITYKERWTLTLKPAVVADFANIGIPLMSTFRQLGQGIKAAVDHRRQLLELVEPLETIVNLEDALLAARGTEA